MRTGFMIVGVLLAMVVALPAHAKEDKASEHATPETLPETLVVYTSRKTELIEPLFKQFEQKTGAKIAFLKDEAPKLIARLEVEGKKSEADVFMAADISNLILATDKGLLTPMTSDVLEKNIPKKYQDAENRWYGLSLRLRPMFYRKGEFSEQDLPTYEQLADPKWKKGILVRNMREYNQALVAHMMAVHGKEYTETWAKGVVANMARKPNGEDTAQLVALANGQGKIALANHYYYLRMAESKNPKEREAFDKLAVFIPNQNAVKGDLQGVHANISGAGVLNTADNPKLATTFVEFLSSKEAQEFYARVNKEYPIRNDVTVSKELSVLGDVKEDPTTFTDIAAQAAEAARLADRAGWK